MSDKIKNRLDRLGLPSNYMGNGYIATSTEYRGGDSATGTWCYENNVWDAIESRFLTWEKFVSICKKISEANAKEWLAGADFEDGKHEEEVKEKVKMEKFLVEQDYEKLVKSYYFFLKRGISAEVLDQFGAGLAQGGPMNGRVIFKIRDKKGKLIGVTGRDVLNRAEKNENFAKWKIKGPKSEFIYPFFEPDVFRRTGQIILCESVGDAISLWNDGIKQVLVTFGVSISAKLISHILAQNPDQIFVSLNNDSDKDENRGQIGAEKVIKKLLPFFSRDKIINAPPFQGDFGDQGQIPGENLRWAAKYKIKL